EASRALLVEAKEQHAARCPWCYALVPVPREAPPLRLGQRPGRLSAGGYVVEVSERGMLTELEVHTPGRRVHDGREPGQFWTLRGATVLLVGPLVLAALLCAALWPAAGGPIYPAGALLGVALGAYVLVRFGWHCHVPPDRRALNHSWSLLVPRLHPDRFN